MHYVNAAKGISGGKLTDSRLSVLTGLQRRDIARLRSLPAPQQRPHHLAKLLVLWQTEPEFAGRDLPNNGSPPSFEALAKQVRKDIHPRTMRDALEAAGAIAIDAKTQTVRLIQTSYQPLAGSDDQLAYLTQNLGDHIDAATDNVLTVSPPHFERAVYYTDLTKEQIIELRRTHATEQMALLERLSTMAAGMKKDAAANVEPKHRFRAGGYFYATKDDDT